jgi:hypothetical protein
MTERLKIGSFIADVEDTDLDAIAIIAIDHMIHGYDFYTIRWLADGHMSSRDRDQIKLLDSEVATKAWCKNCIEYPAGGKS